MKSNWNDKYNRPTLGAIANQAATMESPTTDVRELQQGMPSNTMDHIHEAVERGVGMFKAKKIYVGVIRIFDGPTKTIRNRYFPTTICPTPTFNQAVFDYDRDTNDLRLLWTLPAMSTCNYLKRNALHLDKDNKQLLRYVLDFGDGTLDRLQDTCNTRGVE
jgi:hypothetical protein